MSYGEWATSGVTKRASRQSSQRSVGFSRLRPVPGRTSAATVERTPFTKRPDSSVENCFASSTASFSTTATGVSGQPISSATAIRRTDRSSDRHPVELPVHRCGREQLVDPRLVGLDREHERCCKGVCRDGERRHDLRRWERLERCLVEQPERPLTCQAARALTPIHQARVMYSPERVSTFMRSPWLMNKRHLENEAGLERRRLASAGHPVALDSGLGRRRR